MVAHYCPVHEGEALGLLSAIKWVSKLQLELVDFQLDSKVVVDTFHSTVPNRYEFGVIIELHKSSFSSFFRNSRIEFIKR